MAGSIATILTRAGDVRRAAEAAATLDAALVAIVRVLAAAGADRAEVVTASTVEHRLDPGSWRLTSELLDGRCVVVHGHRTRSTWDDDEGALLAAAIRVALIDHVARGAPDHGQAALEALTLVERTVVGRAAELEQTVLRQRADSRLVESLRVIGQRLTAQLDLDLLVQEATDAATAATGAQFGAFFYNLVNEYGESYTLYTLSGAPREAFEGFPMPRNTAVFAPTFNGEGTVRSADIQADPRYGRSTPYHGQPEGHLPVRSYLAVPVISPTSHEVLGGFFFGHSEFDRFTAGHERVAEGLAGYTAIGLDNARLYARQRTLATELQRSMLPAIGEVPGFTTVARYLPAATGSEVGGDWLDVIDLPGSRTAFVIGDVMGRGVPAASMMGQIRTAVRAYAMLDLSPAAVLRQTSQLVTTMPGHQFITCVFAVHDPVEATLTYANAGHPPPAVIEPDGTVTFLRERLGMPLRVGESFDERVVPFPAGTALVLYTDGLVERRGRPLPDGIEALAGTLSALVAADPSAACDRLIADLTAGTHDDDVALLYARDNSGGRRVAVLPLSADPTAGTRARRFVAHTLSQWGLTDPLRSVAIVVTELVSNAVRHSGAPVALSLHHTGDRLVIEVSDEDDRPPRAGKPSVHDENHRGLLIVETLAQRWGSRPTRWGKIVWAELKVPA
jgi:anti-sigma regulatory factor (Ser/Thr protein kinase)